MTHDEKIVEVVATAEVRYDGYEDLLCLSRTMRERYIDRARAAITAYQAEAWQGEPVAVLRQLLDHVDRETCVHEDTHRGGFIWTICGQCGRRWADDEGGFVPYADPPDVARARIICESLPPAPKATP